jgi:hypothetical protein
LGLKYVGLDILHSLYNGKYFTDPSLYKQLNIRNTPVSVSFAGDTHTADILEVTFNRTLSDEGQSAVQRTAEQDQTFMAREDTLRESYVDSGISILSKTQEFDQNFFDAGAISTESTISYVDSGISKVTLTYQG